MGMAVIGSPVYIFMHVLFSHEMTHEEFRECRPRRSRKTARHRGKRRPRARRRPRSDPAARPPHARAPSERSETDGALLYTYAQTTCQTTAALTASQQHMHRSHSPTQHSPPLAQVIVTWDHDGCVRLLLTLRRGPALRRDHAPCQYPYCRRPRPAHSPPAPPPASWHARSSAGCWSRGWFAPRS